MCYQSICECFTFKAGDEGHLERWIDGLGDDVGGALGRRFDEVIGCECKW